jgi:hypothetical protein
LAAVLGAFSPLIIQRVSQVFYWVLLFIVYVPSLFVPIFMQFDNSSTLLLMQLCMTSGMLFIALSYKVHLLDLPHYPLKRRSFWTMFFILFVFLNAIVLAVSHGRLHLASLDEVYAQRVLGGEIVRANPGLSYVHSALSNVMNPLLIAYGLSAGRRRLIALGIFGQIVIYATGAMKSVLLSPLLIALFYYSLKKDRGGWVPKTGLFFAGTCFAVTELVIGQKVSRILFAVGALLLMRTYAIGGVLLAQYQYFFERHPHTYMAHVTGISWFVHNPYTMATGQEIATYYGEIGANSNAHFFAMDGITGFGLVGIPIMGILCAAVFWLLDSCTRGHTISFSASALTVCIISLTSSSLFSTLLGGGLLAGMLLFIFMPLVE